MKYILIWLKNYWSALLAAFLVGLIYFLPNILIPRQLASEGYTNYHPLNLEAPVLDEVGSYGVKIKEVLEGKFDDGDPYLAEYKHQPTIWGNYYTSLAVGVILKLFGLTDPTPLFVIGDFIFPSLAFLLAFYLFYLLIGDKRWSLLGGLVMIVFPNLGALRLAVAMPWWRQADIFFSATGRLFDDTLPRLLVPSFTLPFFLLALIAFIRLNDKPTIGRMIIAGLTFGALFYVYFYYWMFTVIFFTFFGLWLLWRRDFVLLKFIIGVVATAGLVAWPALAAMVRLLRDSSYAALRLRAGLVVSRTVNLGSIDNYIFIVLMIIIFIWAVKKQYLKNYQAGWLGSALVTTLAVTNIQLIFGFNPQPDHWGSRVTIYILVMGLIIGAWCVMRLARIEIIRRFAPLILIPILMITGAVNKIQTAQLEVWNYQMFPDVSASLAWMASHLPPESVVVTPSTKMNILLPFFTSVNVYVPPINFTIAPTEEVQNRFLEVYKLYNVTPEFFTKIFSFGINGADFKDLFANRRMELDPFFFISGDLDKTLSGYSYHQRELYIPAERVKNLLITYRALAAPVPPTLHLAHHADYLYNGPYERLFNKLKPSLFNNLELVYNHNLVQIYAIH